MECRVLSGVLVLPKRRAWGKQGRTGEARDLGRQALRGKNNQIPKWRFAKE